MDLNSSHGDLYKSKHIIPDLFIFIFCGKYFINYYSIVQIQIPSIYLYIPKFMDKLTKL